MPKRWMNCFGLSTSARSFRTNCVSTSKSVDPATAVHLTVDRAPPAADLLVNLAQRLPPQFQRYPRIAEVIDADEERRRQGRERFKAYRDLKLPLETHQIDEAADV